MKRIAIANLKGGVAKSTTTMMLAESLALFHRSRVLVLDLDPQCNCSIMFLSRAGADQEEMHGRTLRHFISALEARTRQSLASFVCLNASDLEPLCRQPHAGRVDLIPCSVEMWFTQSVFEREAYRAGREPDQVFAHALSLLLETVEDSYDYILFDCPPGFSTLSRAALRLADVILSPTIADPVSVRSLKDFHEISVTKLNASENALYVLVTKFSAQSRVHKFMLDRLRRDYRVIGSPIKFSVDVVRATERNTPQSRRTFNEKYNLQTNAVKSLGRAFLDAIGRGPLRYGREIADQPGRSA
jgi:cellulose biosynthesis protein BcsQ